MNLQFTADLDQAEAFSLLKKLDLPTPKYFSLNQEELIKIHDRDPDTLKKVTLTYVVSWQNNFVTIMPQNETVRGEANLIKVIDDSKNLKKITVIESPQPSFAGYVITFNPTSGNKNQHCVGGTNGCFDPKNFANSSHLLWDVRTTQAVSHYKSKSGLTGIRRIEGLSFVATQPDEQLPPTHFIKVIVDYSIIATRKIFSPLYLEWEVRNGRILFTKIQTVDLHQSLVNNSLSDDQKLFFKNSKQTFNQENIVTKTAVASGVTLSDGIVSGYSNTDILVVSKLTENHLPKLKKYAGVVSYQPILNQTVISFIKTHHLPCLVQVKPELSAQTLKSKLILNASLGKVFKVERVHNSANNTNGSDTTTAYSNVDNLPNIKTTMKVFEWQRNPFYKPSSLNTNQSSSTQFAVDGAIFNNDFLNLLHEISPFQSLKKQPQTYIQKIVSALLTTNQKSSLKGYLLNDLSESQLTNLEYGHSFETMYSESQKNPYFNARGGLHILHNPSLFKAEVTALAIASKKLKKDIPAIVPFLRSVPELVWTSRLLNEVNQEHATNISFFLSLDLPSQIHQLQHFLRPNVKGVVLNVARLHAVSYGLDPENHVLLDHYRIDKSLASQYLAQVTSLVPSNLEVWMILESASTELLVEAFNWGVRAVITKPKLGENYKKTIIEQQIKMTN
jgi:hypothetical protein